MLRAMRLDRLHQRLLRAALLMAAGGVCAGLGIVLFPYSHLAGGLGILAGSVGAVLVVIALIAWAVEVGARPDGET